MANYDYKRMKKEYIKGGITYRELCAKYGCPFGSLRKVAAKEGWTDLKNKAATKADTLMAESIGTQNAKSADKINQVADLLLDRIMRNIQEAPLLDGSSLRQYTASLKDLRDIKGIKSDIDLKEQEARIAKLEKEAAVKAEAMPPTKIIIVGEDNSEETPV